MTSLSSAKEDVTRAIMQPTGADPFELAEEVTEQKDLLRRLPMGPKSHHSRICTRSRPRAMASLRNLAVAR